MHATSTFYTKIFIIKVTKIWPQSDAIDTKQNRSYPTQNRSHPMHNRSPPPRSPLDLPVDLSAATPCLFLDPRHPVDWPERELTAGTDLAETS